MHKGIISKRWENILKDLWTPELLDDLTHFRRSHINYRLCMSNPEGSAERAIKDLIYMLAMQMTKRQWGMLERIKNRNFGDPFVVRVKGELVDLDYVRAVLELHFIMGYWAWEEEPVIVDIGGGYGRLCHSFLSIINVGHYYIVEIEPVLTLAKRYLSEVLGAVDFAKISFITPENITDIKGVDLVLNIDSMNEMPYDMVLDYLDFVNLNSSNFYTKNPVGKYRVKNPENTPYGKSVVEDTLEAGVMCNSIERFDSQSVEKAVPKFLTTYLPGPQWSVGANSWAPPFWHYWEAFYWKDENE